ncbi:MAG TPA: hypothetical protein VMB18_06785 [Terriglobales bacterium]|nr:hypothetical protein [Terriglobales bacterium]
MSMLKKPLPRIALVTCLLLIAGMVALAAAGRKNGIVVSNNGRNVIATHPSGHVVAPPQVPAGLTLIAGNLSKYPFGVYFCCYGDTISGPDSFLGSAYWDAIPFTPTANMTVTKVQASVGWGQNGVNGVTLSINADANGLPGNALGSVDVTGLGDFGDCCQLAQAGGGSQGVPVTAGTQYWFVVSTDTKTETTFDAWAYNTTDMRSYPSAFYATSNGGWINTEGILPGYAIYGQ